MTNSFYISWRTAFLFWQTMLAVHIFSLHQPRRIKSLPLSAALIVLISLPCNFIVKYVHDLGSTPLETRRYWSYCVIFLFLLTIAVTAVLYRVKWASALLMASAGYAAQNIAGNIKGILRLVPIGGSFWNSLPYEILMDCVCYGGCYAILYLIFSGAIRNNQEDYDNEIKAWFALAVIVLRVLTYSMPEELAVQTNATLVRDNLRSIGFRFLLLMVQFGTLQNHQLNRDVDAMKEMIHLQREQFETTRQSSGIIEEKYHDLKKMIAGLSEQIPERELKELEKSIADYSAATKTGNDVLDIILTQKRMLCGKEGITITCVSDPVDLRFVDELDQYSLFNNAVSNAIEAVQRIPADRPRYMTISLREEDGLVFLHAENPCEEPLEFVNGLPRTHQDEDYHGFGMKSMERIADKYNGSLSAQQKEGMFFLDVVLSR